MKTLRLLPIAALSLAVGLMTSCDSTTSSTSGPGIDNLYLDNYDLSAGQGSTGIHATVTTDAAPMTVTLTIKNKATGQDASSYFDLSFTGPTSTATSWSATNDGAAKIGAKSGAPNGTYTLTLTATNSTGASTASKDITVGGGSTGTNLTKNGSVDVGAQSASAGSFISIKGGWSINSGDKTAADEDSIDVVFFADGSNVLYFLSPAKAVNLNLGNLSGWNTKHSTIIVSSTSALTTVDQVKALTDNSSSQSAKVVANGWYAVKLDNGKYGAMQVTAFSDAGRSATASLTVFSN